MTVLELIEALACPDDYEVLVNGSGDVLVDIDDDCKTVEVS